MTNEGIVASRVLIVEDDYFLASDLAIILNHAGATVVGPVGNVRDELDALDPLPDIASLDVKLGDETAFPIADELMRRSVPFVFATGSEGVIPPVYANHPVCSKPVPDAIMVKALTDALRSHDGVV